LRNLKVKKKCRKTQKVSKNGKKILPPKFQIHKNISKTQYKQNSRESGRGTTLAHWRLLIMQAEEHGSHLHAPEQNAHLFGVKFECELNGTRVETNWRKESAL
jgi:hypothetical protein